MQPKGVHHRRGVLRPQGRLAGRLHPCCRDAARWPGAGCCHAQRHGQRAGEVRALGARPPGAARDAAVADTTERGDIRSRDRGLRARQAVGGRAPPPRRHAGEHRPTEPRRVQLRHERVREGAAVGVCVGALCGRKEEAAGPRRGHLQQRDQRLRPEPPLGAGPVLVRPAAAARAPRGRRRGIQRCSQRPSPRHAVAALPALALRDAAERPRDKLGRDLRGGQRLRELRALGAGPLPAGAHAHGRPGAQRDRARRSRRRLREVRPLGDGSARGARGASVLPRAAFADLRRHLGRLLQGWRVGPGLGCGRLHGADRFPSDGGHLRGGAHGL
mmetsp:Transcript_83268/g.258529  ORF Transcript_83268/g.258529 Transcript_83268/m.258529 type:complete len:330 (+) Transcript_83268:252-1241(+)